MARNTLEHGAQYEERRPEQTPRETAREFSEKLELRAPESLRAISEAMNPGTGHRPDWSRGDGRDGAEGVFETLQEFALERDMDREEKQRLAHTVAGAMNESTARDIRNLTEGGESQDRWEVVKAQDAVAPGTRILEQRLESAVQDMENRLVSGDRQSFGESLNDIQGVRKDLEAFQSGENDPLAFDKMLERSNNTFLRLELQAELGGAPRRREISWAGEGSWREEQRQALYDAFQGSQKGMSDEHRERSAENLAGTMTYRLARDAGENGQTQDVMEARTAVGDALLRGGREEFDNACNDVREADMKLNRLLKYGTEFPDRDEIMEFRQDRDTWEKRMGIFQERFNQEHPGMELEGLARQEDAGSGAGLQEKLDQYSSAVFETFQENWRQLTASHDPMQGGNDVARHLRYLAGQAMGETREEWEPSDQSQQRMMEGYYSERGEIARGLAYGHQSMYEHGITMLKKSTLQMEENR